jgi:hypothetical protein
MEEYKEEESRIVAPKIRRAPPPRWGTPLSPDVGLAHRMPLPDDFVAQLESLTAVAPVGLPGNIIGTGDSGLEKAPMDIVDFMAERAKAREERRLKRVREWREKMGDRTGVEIKPGALLARKERGLKLAKGFDPSELALPLTDQQTALATRFLGTDYSKVAIHPKNEVTGIDEVFVPQNRRYFKEFIIQAYARYRLKEVPLIPDPDACAKAAEASKKEVKTFAYQSFVRDYMQKPSPYRGVLVYHGLGSGKTCTSIAALEALYQAHQRPIIVMTPASLQPNYRDEITKCGPYIYRIQNHWMWISVPSLKAPSQEAELLMKVIGVPRSSIKKRGGGWVPDPAKPANFDTLTNVERRQIQEQIVEIMDSRFTFINYNGLSTETVRSWACDPVKKFDGATIVIDEVHNLIRTINNSNLEYFYKDEPRTMPEYKPKFCAVAEKKYNKSYLLYRMLCDAVGAKIIALSATPIINFPQEIAILADLLSGDGRMAEAIVPIMDMTKQAKLNDYLKRHPEVDFAELVPRPDGSGTSTLRITPVPSGFTKVINPKTGDIRGFVRQATAANTEEVARERDLESWFDRVASGTELGRRAKPLFTSFTRLPDIAQQFEEIFIDKERLQVKEATKYLLMGRLSGLISYYKGGKKDLMADAKEEVVYVDMSDQQLKEYIDVRVEEITRERSQENKKTKGGKPDLYEQATKSTSSTFKIFSRAACNFSFPPDMERPKPADYREARKMIGARPGASGDAVMDEGDRSVLDPEGVLLNQVKAGEEIIEEDEIEEDHLVAPPKPTVQARLTYEDALVNAVTQFRNRGAELFSAGALKNMSPKFQAIMDRLKLSQGPALVYSNFKTLEGVGLFGLALEAQEGYKKLDIINDGSKWRLAGDIGKADTPRYISYTGDEDREKRSILLAIFNNKWSKVPGELADEMRRLAGVDNKKGKICRVFMITQSGAEGISLSNVRQVHIMEPYWNYVRLDQVKGRAIRICSHADLPPAERHVDTFIYISRFSAQQIKDRRIAETILVSDGESTTDQAIWELMKAKKKLADSITDVMKAAAVDCELNSTENGGYACYRFKGATMASLFHPLISVDLREGAAAVRALATAAPTAAAPLPSAAALEEVLDADEDVEELT